jgi:hypothetical protein
VAPVERSFYEMPDDPAGCSTQERAFLGTRTTGIGRGSAIAGSPLTEGHTHMKKKLVVATITLLAWPALIVAQKTSYDYEKTANFAGFKTYAHKQGTPVGQSLIDDRIVAAIDTQLGAKGLTKAASDPDVFVVYHMAFDKEKDISTYSSGTGGYGAYGWGWGGGWAGGTSTTQVRDILVGTLVIDMADARKSQLVWRGMGVKEVDTQANPEKRDKSINKAIEKIFKNYPPKVKT